MNQVRLITVNKQEIRAAKVQWHRVIVKPGISYKHAHQTAMVITQASGYVNTTYENIIWNYDLIRAISESTFFQNLHETASMCFLFITVIMPSQLAVKRYIWVPGS